MNLPNLKSDTGAALYPGVTGGIGQTLLNIIPAAWMDSFIVRTALAACVGALCGLIVKDLYIFVKRKIKK